MDTNFRVTRRGFLAGLGLASATAAVGATSACADDSDATPVPNTDSTGATPDATVVFDGPHQAGVDTPLQRHNTTVAFTLRDGVDATGIRRLLRIWTGDARRLTQGEPVLADLEPELASDPGRLTVTCGFGRGLFEKADMTDKAPDWLAPLPEFTGDRLETRWGDRDLVLQICGEDRTTVSHALRVLVRGGADYARPSWSQTGFLDIPQGADGTPGTPRNLFGFKDGTVNPRSDAEFDDQVWMGRTPPPTRPRPVVPAWSSAGSPSTCRCGSPPTGRPVRPRWAARSSRAIHCPVRRNMTSRTHPPSAPTGCR